MSARLHTIYRALTVMFELLVFREKKEELFPNGFHLCKFTSFFISVTVLPSPFALSFLNVDQRNATCRCAEVPD